MHTKVVKTAPAATNGGGENKQTIYSTETNYYTQHRELR